MCSDMPFVFENLPRHKNFCCFSLKFGSLFTGLLTILYTVIALAQCLANLDPHIGTVDKEHFENVFSSFVEVTVLSCHCITLVLATIMLIGVLREKPNLMKPFIFWTSCIVLCNILLVVFCTLILLFSRLVYEPSLLLYFFLTLIAFSIRYYTLTVVSSHYQELAEERLERLRTMLITDAWPCSA